MNLDVDGMIKRIKGIQADPAMSAFRKKMEILPIITAAKIELKENEKQAVRLRKEVDLKSRAVDVMRDMIDAWGENFVGAEPALEKNECSRLHRLMEARDEGRLLCSDNGEFSNDKWPAQLFEDAVPFVVAHDWASVVEPTGGEIAIPYPICAFEFRFGGRNVTVITFQHQDSEDPSTKPGGVAFYEARNGDWVSLGGIVEERPDGQNNFWWLQVRAICIALDAEVASHEVVRQPHALNAKREKTGRPLLVDFHMVDLAKRHRVRSGSEHRSGHQKRLHFCRGHWRHFETSKTWIRWCLKGNPDLGFVDKEYRL